MKIGLLAVEFDRLPISTHSVLRVTLHRVSTAEDIVKHRHAPSGGLTRRFKQLNCLLRRFCRRTRVVKIDERLAKPVIKIRLVRREFNALLQHPHRFRIVFLMDKQTRQTSPSIEILRFRARQPREAFVFGILLLEQLIDAHLLSAFLSVLSTGGLSYRGAEAEIRRAESIVRLRVTRRSELQCLLEGFYRFRICLQIEISRAELLIGAGGVRFQRECFR